MRIKHKSIKETLLVAIIIIVTCEFIYSNTTGDRTSYVLIALSTLGVIFAILNKVKFRKRDIYKFVFALWILAWTINTQSIRYFLTLIMLICWSKLTVKDLKKVIQLLIIIGTILSLYQLGAGQIRIYGFYASSPTQYACTLFVFELYLLVIMSNKGVDKMGTICSVLCLAEIYMTETRSVLAAASLVFIGYLILIISSNFGIKSKKYIIGLCAIVIIPILFLNYDSIFVILQGNFQRTNIDASNFTRNYLYNRVFEIIHADPLLLILGKKGGYIHTIFGVGDVYLPVHQDFLLILTEYGIVGYLGLYFMYLKPHNGKMIVLILFAVCSFHNILLNPIALLFFVITMSDVERIGMDVIPISRKRRTEAQPIVKVNGGL